MRSGIAGFVVLCSAAGLLAQGEAKLPPKRYGVEAEPLVYPQDMPKTALQSVLKAIENKRFDYLLAHLTDPEFVDQRVQMVHGGKFEGLVDETTEKLTKNPSTVKQLRRFLAEGEWEMDENRASAQLKDTQDRVFLKKIKDRWFFENNNKAKAK